MRFLIFSDFHYEPPRFLCSGVEGIKLMQRRAEEEKCKALGLIFVPVLVMELAKALKLIKN